MHLFTDPGVGVDVPPGLLGLLCAGIGIIVIIGLFIGRKR